MSNEIKDNRGRLFEANRVSDKSPSFVGKAVIQGKEWRVALWKNVSNSGQTYLNLDFDEPWVWIENVDSNN